MPTVITHALMAQDVVQTLDATEVSRCIESHPQAYFYGAQGPDFLFFYRYFSNCSGSKYIREIGNELHDNYVNDFYKIAIQYTQSLSGYKKSIFISYMAGHLCHWALDSIAHPYVFHFTGLIENETRYDHFRFEASLDASVVKHVKHLDFKQVQGYKFVQLSALEAQVIADGYATICQQLGFKVSALAIKRALNDMSKIIRWLYDPTHIKFKALTWVEKKILKDPWMITSHLLSGIVDEQHDVLNQSHSVWSHPCDKNMVYCSSFMDLYRHSIERAKTAIDLFELSLNLEAEQLSDFLANRNYSTGLSEEREMNNFNLIYQ